MAGADLSRIHGVITEALIGDVTVLIADQAISTDGLWVELDLRLGVRRDGLQGAREVLDKDPTGLIQGVDVGVEAVSLIGQLLHQGIVVVTHAETNRGELDTLISL